MHPTVDDPALAAALAPDVEPPDEAPARRRRIPWWSPRTIGAVYIWLAIIVLFSILEPDKFFTLQTVKDVLNQNATTGLAALILVVPLASGALDLSIGALMGMGGILVALLLGTGMPVPLAVLLAVVMSAGLGLVNSLVVVGMRVNALIGTLAMGSVYSAAMIALSGDKILTEGMQGSFTKIAQGNISGFTLPVVYLGLLTVLLSVVLEHSPLGRKIYATGYNEATARLVGVPVNVIKVGSMMMAAAVAGFAGIVTASRVQAAQPTNGLDLLMPAVSAAFLGATQIRRGRFNPIGTVIAVLMLGTGDMGLILSGAPQWSPQVFNGVVLIAAVGATVAERGGARMALAGG